MNIFQGIFSKHLVQYFIAQWTPVEINNSTGKFKSLPKEQIETLIILT